MSTATWNSIPAANEGPPFLPLRITLGNCATVESVDMARDAELALGDALPTLLRRGWPDGSA